ncbi:structural maintenance of chromosome 4 [Trypanosoma brucei equiperdum]|uniref:Structural maintenance of chromosomes protein n=1 Tax=Trypanosoma brucei equiperdum TaxID=630700 RepID=A0A3L6KZM9_9TRYP|nr:structural maintenance of chromosome 4 [Trypanosoma brucei equiperdum]
MSCESNGDIAQPVVEKVSRLIIRDIDVENFKSYAGKHRIGPFHKTFATVVGPNGSGKSNVIDAMLFVFGKNARKIRLEKLSELIHTSAAHPNFTYASVTVHFVRLRESAEQQRDPNQREEIPNSVLSIKREVYKTGASQYFIQGTRTTQREVVETLIKEGVDLEHNRFLILQGEVEQIALMKPKAEREGEEGLLEYLDDLIGTNDFAQCISEATREAEAAQQQRLDALDRERKLRAEREALDSAKNSAIEFVKKDNLQQKTLIVLCQLRMQIVEEKLAEPRRLLKEIDNRVEKLKVTVDEKMAEKSAAEDELHKRKKELAEATKERDAARTKRDVAQKEVDRLKSGADEQSKSRKEKEKQIKDAASDIQKAQLQQQDADREAAIHQQNLNEAREQVEKLQKEYDVATERFVSIFTPLLQELDKKKADFAPYEKALVEAKEQLDTAQNRLQLLDVSGTKRQEQLHNIASALQCNMRRIEEVERLLKGADPNKYNAELKGLQETLAKAAEKKHSINASIQDIKNSFSEGESDDRAVRFLLLQRSLKGYYGTLRQLGRIDDAYDVAAGVASNAWSYHVVEDRETAAKALELLRTHDIGRATMIVLKEIERQIGNRMETPFTSPTPKAKRLFDLITPVNDRFRIAFYQALGNTLVVSGLTEAREVAFGGPQRYRVVTLRGELAEPGGSLTGGGNTPRGAGLKAARLPVDKEAVRATLQNLQAELVEAAQAECDAQSRIHELREKQRHLNPAQISQLHVELNTLRAIVEADSQRQARIEREIREASQENERKRRALECAVEEAERQLGAAEKSHIKHRSALEELENKIDNVGGLEYKALCQNLKTQQERVEAEDKALRECRRLSQRLRATQERKERDIAQYNEDLNRILAESSGELEAALVTAKEIAEEVTRAFKGAEMRFNDAQLALEGAKAAVPVAHKALVEAQRRLDDEDRFRQIEVAKMADALQELAKFEQKIDGCEEKIRENVDFYGIETLDLKDNDEERRDEDEENDAVNANDESASQDAERDGRSDNGADEVLSQDREEEKVDVRNMTFRLSAEQLLNYNYDECVHKAKLLSEEAKRLNNMIDFRAVRLWRERDAEHRKGKAEYLRIREISDAADQRLQKLKDERRDCFMACFVRVQNRLREVYQLLTHGGDADLELVDANDPFEGIQFVVRPPKKSWKQISNLSGGEKTLSSLALIFALHDIKPTPIYVMDEIDAALDFRNVSIVANYILRQASGAQFIIISLRNNMFEMAHQLVGVFKRSDVARTVGINPVVFQQKVLSVLQERKRKRTGSTGDVQIKVEDEVACNNEAADILVSSRSASRCRSSVPRAKTTPKSSQKGSGKTPRNCGVAANGVRLKVEEDA